MGCTRSPSGCKEEKLAGVCAEAVAPDGMASVAAEAAAVEKRKLRREISCVAGFLSKLIGKEEWLFHAFGVKNLDLCKRKSRVSSASAPKISPAQLLLESERWVCPLSRCVWLKAKDGSALAANITPLMLVQTHEQR